MQKGKESLLLFLVPTATPALVRRTGLAVVSDLFKRFSVSWKNEQLVRKSEASRPRPGLWSCGEDGPLVVLKNFGATIERTRRGPAAARSQAPDQRRETPRLVPRSVPRPRMPGSKPAGEITVQTMTGAGPVRRLMRKRCVIGHCLTEASKGGIWM